MRKSLFLLLSTASCFIEASGISQPRKVAAEDSCSYWLENISHQGIAAFNSDPSSFQVFRNVKDFGAKGDGITDDTAAINQAISSGNTCAPGKCLTSSTAQALVYFPSGTYMVNSTIIQNYGVSLHGNPNCMPTIKAFSSFANRPGEMGLIDGDPINPVTAEPYYEADNIFYRQLRNIIIDTTLVPAHSSITGVHWPSAQATSIRNVVFNMPSSSGVNHTGVVVDAGGMIFFTDLVFNGGFNAFTCHISQLVMRNLTFNNCVNGLYVEELWTLASSQLHFNNCTTGIRNVVGNGTITMIDSSMKNTKVGIASNFGAAAALPASNSIILENLQLEDVPIVVQNAGNAANLTRPLGTSTIRAWGQGNSYQGSTASHFHGPIAPVHRPAGLLAPGSSDWYARSKPGYETLPLSAFLSARTAGAKGDGSSDDTAALQAAIHATAAESKVLFLDQGSYRVTKTLYIPANTKIVGEAFPNIFAAGNYFADINSPQPLLQVGLPDECGSTELSDFLLGTQGSTPGAILIEHNLVSTVAAVGGYWDVDTRIGGWTGSQQSVGDCPTTPELVKPPVKEGCMAAFMSMHVTKSASGVYMDNCWLWTANFDMDDFNDTQVQIFTGRGLLVESEVGNNWFTCCPTEHHSKYQYNIVNTKSMYMSQPEAESAYYQPNPNATYPYPYNARLHDPVYTAPTHPTLAPTGMGWSQRIVNSSDISIYASAYFSWFNNWSGDCVDNHTCQQNAFSIDESSTNITIYAFTTGNMVNLITRNGVEVFPSVAAEGLPNSIAMFRQ